MKFHIYLRCLPIFEIHYDTPDEKTFWNAHTDFFEAFEETSTKEETIHLDQFNVIDEQTTITRQDMIRWKRVLNLSSDRYVEGEWFATFPEETIKTHLLLCRLFSIKAPPACMRYFVNPSLVVPRRQGHNTCSDRSMWSLDRFMKYLEALQDEPTVYLEVWKLVVSRFNVDVIESHPQFKTACFCHFDENDESSSFYSYHKTFMSRFKNLWPFAEDDGEFNWDNIVVGGGFVYRGIDEHTNQRDYRERSDIDLFVYGTYNKYQIVQQVCDTLIQKGHSVFIDDGWSSETVVNICVDEYQVLQMVFTNQKEVDPYQILWCFDLSHCQWGYHPRIGVFSTWFGRHAFQTKTTYMMNCPNHSAVFDCIVAKAKSRGYKFDDTDTCCLSQRKRDILDSYSPTRLSGFRIGDLNKESTMFELAAKRFLNLVPWKINISSRNKRHKNNDLDMSK
eukprot:GILJ01016627.1.p1 GENE.GILJ01016627.1~~GILJ01016627.1.p1  ORF type:complete len:448 (+),score=45.96 GILJ01016627.1:725-2068(+)